MVSWRSSRSKAADKIATNLIRVYEAVEKGMPTKSVAWTRSYNTSNQQDCEDIIRMIVRTIKNEKTVANAVKLLQSLVGNYVYFSMGSSRRKPLIITTLLLSSSK